MWKKILIFTLLSLTLIIVIIINNSPALPPNTKKVTPEIDLYPPMLHSSEYEKPVPLDVVNTAGGEDTPFFSTDRDELYFGRVSDVNLAPEKQLFDGITGIYLSKRINGQFQPPERVILNEPDKVGLDGCQFVDGNVMWFCSIREGYEQINWFTAQHINGKWSNWEIVDFDKNYEVGELHIYNDELYYDSSRDTGNKDIWVSKKVDGKWQEPKNIDSVNTIDDEFQPFVTEDELWFTKTYNGSPAIFRSKKINNEWQQPELIISQFAAEPTLDKQGNIYFAHHFFEKNKMVEADIYVAYKK
jgi:hypothetical protein